MKNLVWDNQCLAKSFNYTVRYIDDLLTFNNTKFETKITFTLWCLYFTTNKNR